MSDQSVRDQVPPAIEARIHTLEALLTVARAERDIATEQRNTAYQLGRDEALRELRAWLDETAPHLVWDFEVRYVRPPHQPGTR